MIRTFAALAAVLTLAACGPKPDATTDTAANPAPETPAAKPAPAVAEAWVGKWIGPEGLFLDIKAKDAAGHHPITLKDNLDTQADYVATQTAEGLTFNRGDDVITIRPGTGADTGFKYLAEKSDCLILVKGVEGYCRS